MKVDFERHIQDIIRDYENRLNESERRRMESEANFKNRLLKQEEELE